MVQFIRSDLEFILNQILIAEAGGTDGSNVVNILPNVQVPWGLRTVDGSFNNLVFNEALGIDQTLYGATDTIFPRLTTPVFQDADPIPVGFPGTGTPTSYTQTSGLVFDADPRIISNLIVDETAVAAAATNSGAGTVISPGLDGLFGTADDIAVNFIHASQRSIVERATQSFGHGVSLLANKIRIGVVDVYPIFREGVVHAIGRVDDLTVVAEGASAEDAKRIASQCDVILLERAVPESLGATRAILQNTPNTKIVFFSATEDDEHASRALHLGVHGYLMKGVSGTDLLNALRAVYLGARKIGSDLAWRLLTQSKAVAPARPPPLLTVREQQVLDHTSRGLTNAEMAGLLGLSVSTIKRHKTKMFRRMGVRNRLEAIATASESRKPKLI